MSDRFQLTAELRLQAPTNVKAVAAQIQKQLNGISANINIKVPGAQQARFNAIGKAVTGATRAVDNFSKSLGLAITNVTKLRNSYAQLNAVVGLTNSNLQKMVQTANGLSSLPQNINQANQAVQKTTKTVTQATQGFEEFGAAAGLAFRRYAAFSLAAGSVFKLAQAIRTGITEAISFQQEIVRLGQVSGKTESQLTGIKDQITSLSTGLGVSSKELLGVATTLQQAGLSADKTKIALDTLAKTNLAPTFDSLSDTTEGVIAILGQFRKGTTTTLQDVQNLEKQLGSINAVSAAYAVESADLISVIRRTGGAFSAAGGSLEELIALFTSVRSTTRESAETIGTAFRTIVTRLQRTETIDFLKGIGIELTNLEGKFVGPFEAVKRLSAGLNTLDSTDIRFSQIVEELGGYRQISKVIPLIQEFKTSQEALSVALRGQNSLNDNVIQSQAALAIQIAKVKEEFFALFRTIADSEGFRSFLSLVLDTTSALIGLAKRAEPLIPIFAALSAAGIAKFGLLAGKGFSKALGFAGGGLVPGKGNSDTVPAMLTPGEYVLRKDAVKAIGVNNLAKANKYAKGGVVETNEIVAQIAPKGRPSDPNTYSYTGGTLKYFRKRPEIYKQLQENGLEPSDIRFGAKVQNSVLSDASTRAYDNFSSSIVSNLQSRVSDKLSKLGGQAKPLDTKAIQTIEGYLFENFVSSISRISNRGGNADFDFVGNLGGLNEFLEDPVKSKYIDAKRTLASRALIVRKALNQGLFDKEIINLNDTDIEELKAKKLKSINQKQAKSQTKTPQRVNSGGIIDSVPALLTPGEYVLNKDAVSSIGVGNLHKLNKLKPQEFNTGGFVDGNGFKRLNFGNFIGGALNSGAKLFGRGSQFRDRTLSSTAVGGALNNSKNLTELRDATARQIKALNPGISLQEANTKSLKMINALYKKYGVDLGIVVDKTTGQIKGLASLQSGIDNVAKKANLARREKFVNGVNSRLAPLGGLGGTVGIAAGFASSAVTDPKNQARVQAVGVGAFGGQVGSQVGGVIGTAIAPIFGPLAPVIPLLGKGLGALAGAAIGYSTTFDSLNAEIEKEKALDSLNKSAEALSGSLDKYDELTQKGLSTQEELQKVSQNYATLLESSKNAVDTSTKADRSGFSNALSFLGLGTSYEDQDAASRVRAIAADSAGLNQSEKVLSLLTTKEAKTGLTEQEKRTQNIAQDELIQRSAAQEALRKVSINPELDLLTEFRKAVMDFGKSIPANTDKLRENQKELDVNTKRYNELIIANRNFVNELNTLSANFDFAAEKAAIEFEQNQTGPKSSVNINRAGFNLGVGDQANVLSSLDQLRQAGGDEQTLNQASEIDNLIRAFQAEGGILSKIDTFKASKSGDLRTEINQALSGGKGVTGPGLSPELRANVADLLEQAIRDRPEGETGPLQSEEALKAIDPLVKAIIPALGKNTDLLKANEERMIKLGEIYAQSISVLDGLRERGVSIAGARTKFQQQAEADLRGVSVNKAFSIEQQQSPFIKQINNLTGGNAKTLAQINPEEIANTIEEQLQALNKSEKGSLEQVELQRSIDNNKKALEALTDATEVNTPILNKLSELQAQAQSIKDVRTRFAFGSNEDRRELARGAALTEQARQNGIDSIPEKDRGAVLSFLQGLGVAGQEEINRLSGGGTAGDIFNGIIDKLEAQQSELIKRADANFGLAQQANTLLENIAQNTALTDQQKLQEAQKKANGGLIYRNAGGSIFKPQGTDTVPAMLTPGEFVVNARATKDNFGLLSSINAGYYSKGDIVSKNRPYKTRTYNPSEEYKDRPYQVSYYNGPTVTEGENLALVAKQNIEERKSQPDINDKVKESLAGLNAAMKRVQENTPVTFLPDLASGPYKPYKPSLEPLPYFPSNQPENGPKFQKLPYFPSGKPDSGPKFENFNNSDSFSFRKTERKARSEQFKYQRQLERNARAKLRDSEASAKESRLKTINPLRGLSGDDRKLALFAKREGLSSDEARKEVARRGNYGRARSAGQQAEYDARQIRRAERRAKAQDLRNRTTFYGAPTLPSFRGYSGTADLGQRTVKSRGYGGVARFANGGQVGSGSGPDYSAFSAAANNLANAINNNPIPSEISLNVGEIKVTLNGQNAMNTLVEKFVLKETISALESRISSMEKKSGSGPSGNGLGEAS